MIKAEFFDLGPHNEMGEPDSKGSYWAFEVRDLGQPGDEAQLLTLCVPAHQMPIEAEKEEVMTHPEDYAYPVAPGDVPYWQPGMTTREWFAGMALSGLAASEGDAAPSYAVWLADRTLEELAKASCAEQTENRNVNRAALRQDEGGE